MKYAIVSEIGCCTCESIYTISAGGRAGSGGYLLVECDRLGRGRLIWQWGGTVSLPDIASSWTCNWFSSGFFHLMIDRNVISICSSTAFRLISLVSCFCQYSRGESWSHLLHPEILFSMLHDRSRHLLSVAWLYLTDILALYKVEAASLILSSVVLRCHRCISVCLPSYLASTWSLLLSHRRAIKKNTVQQNVQKTWCYYPAVDQVGATETCAGDFTMVSRVYLNTTMYYPHSFVRLLNRTILSSQVGCSSLLGVSCEILWGWVRWEECWRTRSGGYFKLLVSCRV